MEEEEVERMCRDGGRRVLSWLTDMGLLPFPVLPLFSNVRLGARLRFNIVNRVPNMAGGGVCCCCCCWSLTDILVLRALSLISNLWGWLKASFTGLRVAAVWGLCMVLIVYCYGEFRACELVISCDICALQPRVSYWERKIETILLHNIQHLFY